MKTIGEEAAEKIAKEIGIFWQFKHHAAAIIDKIVRERKERGDEPCHTSGIKSKTRPSNPASNVQPAGAGSSLRATAERIIEGIPISYRDGDEVSGRERTVSWLMWLLEDYGEADTRRLVSAAAKERSEADTKRLEWLSDHPFMAYRNRDPETKKLYDHFTLVDEDKPSRTGIVKSTLREAIDAAMKGK